MPPPRYLRSDPQTGLDVFEAEDGREVSVDTSRSPFAQSLRAAGGFMRSATPLILPGGDVPAQPAPFASSFQDLPNPSEWAVVPQEPVPEAPPQPFTYHRSTVPMATAPQAPIPGVPNEWLANPAAPAHAGLPAEPAPPPAPPSMRGVASSLLAADPSAAAPASPATAPPPSAALDLTGGGGSARAPRAGGGARRSAVPAVNPLDELMVPDGYQDPTRAIAGSPRDRMLDRGEALVDQAGEAAAARAGLAGTAADMAREAVEESEARRVELEQERRAAMGAARDRLRRANERVAAMQVDPGRMFRQPGDVVGAAIGIALGAAASAISDDPSHQQNALALIQQHVDRDIEAQRANIGNAQAALAGEESLVALMGQEFESREAAEHAARAAMLEGVAQRVARMEADLGSSEARLQAEQMRYDLQQSAAAAQAAAIATEEDRQIERALALSRIRQQNARAARDERRGAGGGGAATPRAPSAATMAQYNQLVGSGADPQQTAADLRIPPQYIPRDGAFQAPTTGEQAGTVAALSAQLDALEELIPRDESEDIAGVGMTGMLPGPIISERGRAVRQQVDAVEELIGRVHSGGAISGEEEERFRGLLGSDTDEGLRRGIEIIRREIAARADRQPSTRSVPQRTDEALGSVGARRVE